MGVGNRGTTKLEAGVSGASGTVDYALGLLRDESDGFNARPIAGQNPDKDGYRNTAGNARVGVQLNSVHRLEGTLMVGDTNSGYDSGLGKDDRNLHTMHALGLQLAGTVEQRLQNQVQRDRFARRIRNQALGRTCRTRACAATCSRTNGAKVRTLVTAALERREDHLENNPIDRDRSQNGVALGYGYNAGGHTVQVNLRHDEDSEFGGKGTGSVAYGYAITPQWRATASVGTAFRAPTLYQRFSQYGVASLNPRPRATPNWACAMPRAAAASRWWRFATGCVT